MNKWITFDLDGTLMQNPFSAWIFPEVEQLICGELNRNIEVGKALFQEHKLRMERRETVAAYDWDDIVRQLSQEWGLSLSIDIEQLLLKHAAAPKIYLLDDTVLPTLEELKKKGYSLAAVTNGFRKYQYPVMEKLGIGSLFDDIVTPERMGCGKPDSGILRELRQDGIIMAHVGDRLDHDIHMANQSGIPSVLVARDLPAGLELLSPAKRTAQAPFLQHCEEQLRKENPELHATLEPEAYRPAYAICQIDELLACIDELSLRSGSATAAD
ncbi:HAD family hydrolase [Paenibacillus apiarius]|uniref:HAD family hydrolase n=1 Tax=Paenibacillus apiarius TaxID=46240 RepID=A0ABT4DMH3_9BACL|nr:HAD family hydrolase [Paenibacillus apiarius]MCY9514572.1 HAD family hydrolase [Paenibacillus apiarius]MCY9518562.1 HAD family hydrolase [Paenibacillus apiarius]MCY9552650.1 HAD family hydrolase [Paenibacillus apiarius]MCY9557022.1 HAD family hydrolase [Paenibacillus apiarius]MCY9686025.1 HAD family hydrolase [Paenibacillus apiarius]